MPRIHLYFYTQPKLGFPGFNYLLHYIVCVVFTCGIMEWACVLQKSQDYYLPKKPIQVTHPRSLVKSSTHNYTLFTIQVKPVCYLPKLHVQETLSKLPAKKLLKLILKKPVQVTCPRNHPSHSLSKSLSQETHPRNLSKKPVQPTHQRNPSKSPTQETRPSHPPKKLVQVTHPRNPSKKPIEETTHQRNPSKSPTQETCPSHPPKKHIQETYRRNQSNPPTKETHPSHPPKKPVQVTHPRNPSKSPTQETHPSHPPKKPIQETY